MSDVEGSIDDVAPTESGVLANHGHARHPLTQRCCHHKGPARLPRRCHRDFGSNDDLSVQQQNRSQHHKILARITDHITVASAQPSNYIELVDGAKVKYRVQHIWENRPECHTNEFNHPADFALHRNRIGDLLPKQFNASYNDDAYRKLVHCFGQNLLAATLNSLSYEKIPGFVTFSKSSGLTLKAYDELRAADVIERGNPYRAIANQGRKPDDLLAVAQRCA